MKQRLDFLDVAKGIGIILVLMGHSCGIIFAGDYITAFYMAMFFVVAGYVYRPSDRSYGENIKKRLKRILGPYFVYNTLLFGFYIFKGVVGKDLEMPDAIAAIAGVCYSRNSLWVAREDNIYFFKLLNDPVWFLTAMCVASMIFYAIVEKCLTSKKNCGLISTVLIAVTAFMSFLPVLLPWSIDSAPLFALFMVTGALLGRVDFFQKNYRWQQWLGMLAVIALSVVVRIWNGKTNLSVRVYGERGVISVLCVAFIGVAGSVALIWISKFLCKCRSLECIFSYVGRNSMVIMALHMAIFQVEDIVAGKILSEIIKNPVVYWIYAAIKIVVAVMICIVFAKIEGWVKKKLK